MITGKADTTYMLQPLTVILFFLQESPDAFMEMKLRLGADGMLSFHLKLKESEYFKKGKQEPISYYGS